MVSEEVKGNDVEKQNKGNKETILNNKIIITFYRVLEEVYKDYKDTQLLNNKFLPTSNLDHALVTTNLEYAFIGDTKEGKDLSEEIPYGNVTLKDIMKRVEKGESAEILITANLPHDAKFLEKIRDSLKEKFEKALGEGYEVSIRVSSLPESREETKAGYYITIKKK